MCFTISPAASGKGTGISPTDDPRYWCRISWGSTGAADEVEIEKLWTAKGSDGPRKKLQKLDFHQSYEVIDVSLSDIFLMGNFSVISSFNPMAVYYYDFLVLIWKREGYFKNRGPLIEERIMFFELQFLFLIRQNIAGWCQQTFYFQKFVCKAQQCFAITPQVNFPSHNLNFHWSWRWWDWIQATF